MGIISEVGFSFFLSLNSICLIANKPAKLPDVYESGIVKSGLKETKMGCEPLEWD